MVRTFARVPTLCLEKFPKVRSRASANGTDSTRAVGWIYLCGLFPVVDTTAVKLGMLNENSRLLDDIWEGGVIGF